MASDPAAGLATRAGRPLALAGWSRRVWALAALAAIVPAAAGVWYRGDRDGEQDRSAAREIVALTNAMRTGGGQAPLGASLELTRAAEQYARELAASGTLDHRGPDGSAVDVRAEGHAYRGWSVLAENLAVSSGAPDAAAVVEAWLRSEPHRRNLLSQDLRDVGAGCYVVSAPAKYWCVLEFGAMAGP